MIWAWVAAAFLAGGGLGMLFMGACAGRRRWELEEENMRLRAALGVTPDDDGTEG